MRQDLLICSVCIISQWETDNEVSIQSHQSPSNQIKLLVVPQFQVDPDEFEILPTPGLETTMYSLFRVAASRSFVRISILYHTRLRY